MANNRLGAFADEILHDITKYTLSEVARAVATERERIIAALLVMHEENKMHHNYYGCLAKLMQDGRL